MGRLNRKIAKFFGYDLMRYKKSFGFDAVLDRIYRNFEFDAVIDVGSNAGFFSERSLATIPAIPVYSFEPASDLAQSLEKRAAKEPRWHVSRQALGDASGQALLNISESKGVYNSLNGINPAFVDTIDGLAFDHSEEVSVTTFDGFVASDAKLTGCQNILLKVDTQGHDFKVLKGALKSLPKVKLVIVELPFQNIYDSTETYKDILNLMDEAGFDIYALSPISSDKTGALIEADGFFVRR